MAEAARTSVRARSPRAAPRPGDETGRPTRGGAPSRAGVGGRAGSGGWAFREARPSRREQGIHRKQEGRCPAREPRPRRGETWSSVNQGARTERVCPEGAGGVKEGKYQSNDSPKLYLGASSGFPLTPVLPPSSSDYLYAVVQPQAPLPRAHRFRRPQGLPFYGDVARKNYTSAQGAK